MCVCDNGDCDDNVDCVVDCDAGDSEDFVCVKLYLAAYGYLSMMVRQYILVIVWQKTMTACMCMCVCVYVCTCVVCVMCVCVYVCMCVCVYVW